jgi:hypothetical protein
MYHRLAVLLELYPPQGYEQSGSPLTKTEIDIVLEQLESAVKIFNGHVSAATTDASLKLRRALWSLHP